jgi:hypothetical protein
MAGIYHLCIKGKLHAIKIKYFMKTLVYAIYLITAILMTDLEASSKIWRINNTGIPADFTSANAASTSPSVVNGDTLHIEPSGLSYGNLDINKRLVIIGNGYFLGDASANLNPNLQANTAQSILGNVVISTGANETVMMGIICTTISIGGANNVVLKRNNMQRLEIGTTNNFQIIGNYVGQYVRKVAGLGYLASNVVLSNNIIIGLVGFEAADNGIFSNNVIVNNNVIGGQQFEASVSLANFVVRNNIKVQNNQGMNLVNCTIQNNTDCTGASGFGTTNGNTGNVDMSTVFVGWPTIGSFSTDGRYALKAGSPALGTGFGGADRGAILNPANSSNNMADTYVLSGIPAVPSVFRFDVPTSVSAGTMNVTISTRTNQ